MKERCIKVIAKEFGFSTSKIVPLECSFSDDCIYVMFAVCGITYQAYICSPFVKTISIFKD
jgi:hypothetical protein